MLLDGINEIMNPLQYLSTNTVVYAKVTDTNGCFNIAKINLIVLPPVPSSVLKDKTICIGEKQILMQVPDSMVMNGAPEQQPLPLKM